MEYLCGYSCVASPYKMPIGSIRFPASAGRGAVGGGSSGSGNDEEFDDDSNYPPVTGDRDLVYLDGRNTTDGGGKTLQIPMNLPPGR